MAAFEECLRRFLDHFERISNCADDDVFLKEFMALKTLSQRYRENNTYPMEAGMLQCNKKKNRFKDILPFEYTRVSLHPVEGLEGSDYINANYIMGLDDQVTYIASQGPLPHTISDFWRMIWYHNIEIVVMACKVVEMAKPKCERYWPEVNQSMKIGAIKVTTLNEQNISNDFVIRDLMAECQGEQQYIRQYHYAAWPDHGKPTSPEPVLRMLDRIHDDRKRMDVPVVIHCSAGCGRTGTIIGIDLARTMLQNKEVPGDDLSVYRLVEKMRQQRPAMVQAKDQYVFVYLAVAELSKRALGMKPNVPRKPNGRPIGPSTPTPVTPTPTTTSSAADGSPDNVYQNTAAVVAPPRKKSNYENVSSSSIGGASSMDTGGTDDTHDKKKPVPRTRNSLRNRGGASGGGGRTMEDMSQSPPLIEQDERLPGNLGVVGIGGGGGGSGGVSSREDSISPDLRNNTPSPRPKPRGGKRGLDSDNGGAPPPRPVKPHSTSSPSKRPPGPPPKIPKTIISDSSLTSSSSTAAAAAGGGGGKKKPIPALPPRESTPENRLSSGGGGGGGGVKRSLAGNQERTEVLDVSSGKSLPLEFVEREMESAGGEADTSKSSSIFDTIISLVGDEVLDEVDSAENSHTSSTPIKVLPSPASGLNRSLDYSDEAPPIPAHTMASMELVEQRKPTAGASSGGGGAKGGRSKSPVIQEPLSSTYDVVGAITETVYEQPEPPKLSVPSSSQKASSFHGPHVGRDSGPPPLPPANKPAATLDSASTATAISTMARHTSDTNVNGHGGGSSHTSKPKKGLFSFGKHKDKKKDKVSTEEISGPLTIGGGSGLVKSPSINTMSSSTSSSHSPMHDRANNKYSFPGDLGYGVRIKKPAGPRREPPHWPNSHTLPIANKA